MTEITETRKYVFTIVLSVIGLILFWRGLWDLSEKVFSPEVSLAIGAAMLCGVAIIDRKQILGFFKL
jgi:hypothetical protein